MGLSAIICDTSPSSTLVQGVSVVDSLDSPVPDNASLSKPQHPVPLLSLNPKTNLDTNPVLPAPLDSQPISSGHLRMALPCLSQTVGLKSEQSRTSAVSLEPSQTIFQNSLSSAPLSSLSQSGKLVSGPPVTSLPSTLLQASSQHSLLSVPLSSLSGQVGAPSLSERLTPAPQNPPLSLNSLSQWSCKQVLSPSEPSHAMSESPLLSVPLSSLSQYSGLSFGKPPLGPLLQTTSPSPFLSIPLGTLSQTPTSVSESHPSYYQDPLSSAPLSSLSQSRCFPSGHAAALLSSTLGCSLTVSETFEAVESLISLSKPTEMPVVEVHVKTHESGTADVNISPEEEDFSRNHKAEQNKLFPVAPPVEHPLNIYNKGYQKKCMHQERQLTRTCNNTYPLTAKPTMFALALCCSTCAFAKNLLANKTVVQRVVKELYNLDCLHVVPFDFSSPSPDDIVNERQKGAFGKKK
ncbi:hypothetical protein OS493_001301 [Desmophyllum pertusum]|uniref:Uncharacterized protein n=1 Tax=Desmophyllum pertusum TaxID=174260 RepID=A0A9W9ZUG4_9CNID|nr:hypothetical protein OS493_001301 [Desmophyllum pertusum]